VNVEETTRLIRLLEASYNREAPADAVAAWTMVLADAPYRWARDGALDLMRDHPYWPTPADVRLRARKLYEEHKAAQAREAQLALGASVPPEPPPAAEKGPDLVRALLSEVAARNKGITDRAVRRANAQQVATEFKDRMELAPPRPGQPCTSKTCRCTHTDGCDAGWIDMDRGDGVMQAFPCGQCNPRRHTVLTSRSTREAAQRALRDTSDVKAQEGDAW